MTSDTRFDSIEHIPLPVSVLELDAAGRPCYVALNAAGRALGPISIEDVLGKTVVEVFGEETGTKVYEAHKSAFDTGEVVVAEQSVLIDGRERVLRSTITPVADKDGHVAHVIGMPIDVTSDVAVTKLEESSQQVNREMEQFLSFAAHDLRSPMRKVHQLASMLRKGVPQISEDCSRLLDMLETVASKSMRMISDVLSHAEAVDAASGDFNHEPFGLMAVCWNVLHTIDPEQKHEWEIGNTRIVGDQIATQVVIRNLLDNAIKHNTEALKLSVDARQVGSGWIEVVVSDNGKGFLVDRGEQIQTGKISGEGGFGLSGVRRLVASRGGSLSFEESVPGEGATIRVKLPGVIVDSLEDSSAA